LTNWYIQTGSTHFLVVNDLSLELLLHLGLGGAIVVDVGPLAQGQAVELSTDGLEKGAAA
jgi:hypothetical protein